MPVIDPVEGVSTPRSSVFRADRGRPCCVHSYWNCYRAAGTGVAGAFCALAAQRCAGGRVLHGAVLASIFGVALSGVLVPKGGYRLAMILGLVFMAAGVGFLPLGSRFVGLAAVACYGVGLGLTIPTCNLLVAEVNPANRASALSLLNFSWTRGSGGLPLSAGALSACGQDLDFLLCGGRVRFSGCVVAGVGKPAEGPRLFEGFPRIVHAIVACARDADRDCVRRFVFRLRGDGELGGRLGGVVCEKSDGAPGHDLGDHSLLLLWRTARRARAGAVFMRKISEVLLVRLSVTTALLGLMALLAVHSMVLVLASAAIIGLGLAAIYPITISLLANCFGPMAARVGSVMFMLASFGAACMPWLVGVTSTEMSSLKFGLAIPLLGCVLMLVLYLRDWNKAMLI